MPALRFSVLIALLVAGAWTPAAAQEDLAAYIIRSFDTDLTIEAHSDLLVEERLEVEFTE